MKIRFKIAALILLSFIFGGATSAQQLPGPADPGRMLDDRRPQAPPPQAMPDQMVVDTRMPSEAPAGFDKIRVTPQKFVFEGGSVFSQAELDGFTAGLVGRDVTMKDVFDVTSRITAEYRARGYILSRAVLPPQEIEGGVIRIRLVEGFIHRIMTEGAYAPHPVVTDVLRRLKKEGAFSVNRLEKYMLVLNGLTGLQAKAVLQPVPDPAPEGAIGLLIVFADLGASGGASVSIDNAGSVYVGPYQAAASAWHDNLFGWRGRTTADYITSAQMKELHYLALSQSYPINGSGLEVIGSASVSRSQPGDTLAQTDIKSKSWQVSAKLVQPIIKSRLQNLSIAAELILNKISSTTFNDDLYDDRLRPLRLSISWDGADTWRGRSTVDFIFSQGLDVFGVHESGSENLSREEGRSDFTKYEISVSRLQTLPRGFNLFGQVSGQFTDDVLLSSEEFGYGGANVGKAFDSSEITGDRGIAGVIELRYTQVPEIAGVQAEPYAFYDAGQVWNLDTGEDNVFGSSAGAGSRFGAGGGISGDVYVAFPIGLDRAAPEYGNGSTPSINFRLTKRF